MMDARAWRGWGNGISDHHIVVARIRVQKRWVRGRRRGQEGSAPVRKVERLSEDGKREEYERAVEERLGRYELEQLRSVEGMNEKFVEGICAACEEVCGVRRRRKGVQGTAWWCDEVRVAVAQKKKAYEEWMRSRGQGEIERQKREVYVQRKREVKRIVKESKRRVDEFGRNLSEKWKECKKLFWKEVKKVRQGNQGSNKGVKDKNGRELV
ncbi:hypothetical protein, partial [Klebsiella pneumoniae]|uniref:hypothetical protein n=1 Tax=Klebsiella pneumoniae TaxID=573 RepID=UPI003EBBC7E1